MLRVKAQIIIGGDFAMSALNILEMEVSNRVSEDIEADPRFVAAFGLLSSYTSISRVTLARSKIWKHVISIAKKYLRKR